MIATLVDMSITQAMLMTDTYERVRETRGIMTNIDLRMKYLRAGFRLQWVTLDSNAKRRSTGRSLNIANA